MKQLLLLILALGFSTGQAVHADTNPVKLSRLSLTARADGGEVTFTYHLTPQNKSADAGMQVYAHRDDITGHEQWDLIAPANKDGSPLILTLYRGLDNTGTFVLTLPKSRYGSVRVILFAAPDGKSVDFGQTLYDSKNDPQRQALRLDLTVKTNAVPVKSPTLVISAARITDNGDGTSTVTIPIDVRIPPGYTPPDGDNGFWVMAKGSGGFSQVWVDRKDARPRDDSDSQYEVIPAELTLKSVSPGLWNVQFGLFQSSFRDALQWVWPGLDFEVGGDRWVQRAPEERIPPRLHVRQGRFVTLSGMPYDFYAENPAGRKAVPFVRGGDYGNALDWDITPALNTSGYFTLLGDMGCHFLRVLFNPDRYPTDMLYQHAVDQVVQNIWAAGLYPILCPQDLPQGNTLAERVDRGLIVVKSMAAKYQGRNVWIEVCNEPHEFPTWAAWRPIAQRYAEAARAFDPQAFIVVPFEGWSKDGRAAARVPLPTGLVDLYDGHAYVPPGEVAALYGPPAKAGLPILIGEFGSNDPPYLRRMCAALQALPRGVLAVSPWAFTVKGQDQLPLIADGGTAQLKFTPSGQAIADAYAAWDAGKRL